MNRKLNINILTVAYDSKWMMKRENEIGGSIRMSSR